ncbi:hypothetical protein V8G54_001060 [Vigna mungo]|uniref:WAT1-related protein n=1 Tax=Vigna mungo TaxID=3915 RepID=A0AAQ3SB48_VIGMU
MILIHTSTLAKLSFDYIYRLEKLNLEVAEGRAKVIGTIIGISGAMFVTFVKGTEINICSFKINLMHGHASSSPTQFRNKLLGVPLAILSCCFYSLWFILQGIVASGIMVVIIAWCIKRRGPLFVAIFSPLQLVLVDIAAYFMLDEKLYVGSVVGAVMIVCGLYVVLWGKAKEMKKKSELVSLENTTRREFENVEVVSSPPRSQQL